MGAERLDLQATGGKARQHGFTPSSRLRRCHLLLLAVALVTSRSS
jgi:hypothetical protein